MSSEEKLAIVGAGAIGSLVGGILARAGKDIKLIGRKKHMAVVNENGLTINGVAGDFNVRVKTAEQLDFKPDIILIAVKTQDVEQICQEIKSIDSDIPILMMQNGIRSADMAASILGKRYLISCILLLNARFLQPGVVNYVNRRPIVIGEAFKTNSLKTKWIKNILDHVSDTFISNNIRGAQWTKLVINAMSNSIDAMTGLTLGEYVKRDEIRRVAVEILKEALRVVDSAGIKLESLPGIPISIFKVMIGLPTPMAALLLRYMMRSKGNSDIMTSTLQSIRMGQKTEIDYINGEFVKLGERLGIRTPFNAKAVELIQQIEESKVFLSPEQLKTHFSFI
ncbi:MAG: ketopantoate reductase family protein [Desulfobacteraceae bacterium]|nr:ketopantoate reductase family protein [Desulfobacteraceae bacterium]